MAPEGQAMNEMPAFKVQSFEKLNLPSRWLELLWTLISGLWGDFIEDQSLGLRSLPNMFVELLSFSAFRAFKGIGEELLDFFTTRP